MSGVPIVFHILSGDLWGGAEAQMCFQIQALRQSGWDARAVLFNRGEVHDRYQRAGIPCEVFEESSGVRHVFGSLTSLCKKTRPVLIVAHGYKQNIIGCLAARLLGIPLVSTFHGLTETYTGWKRIKGGVYLLASSYIARWLAAGIVVPTAALARQLGFSSLPKLRVISNVASPTPDARSDIDLKHPAVVMAGRLVPVKRADRGIDALRLLVKEHGRSLHLYVAGNGPEAGTLAGMVTRYGLGERVHLLGFRPDAPALIGAADLLLLTSESEGFPTVLLEALFAGIPAVVSRLPGIVETLEPFPDYPIRFVERADVSGYARAIDELLGSSRASSDLVTRLQEHFSPRRAAQNHSELYRSILDRRSP